MRVTNGSVGLLLACALLLPVTGGCGKSKSRRLAAAADAGAQAQVEGRAERQAEQARPDLSQEQQARFDALSAGSPLLPLDLARALIGSPSPWAGDIVHKVYPDARTAEENPRVNLLLEPGDAGKPVKQVDVRWQSTDRARIGSVVFNYDKPTDAAALEAAIREVARPEEGAPHDWLTTEGSLRLSYYPTGYEGGTRLAVEALQPEGAPIAREEDKMKEVQGWDVAHPRPSRAAEEEPDARLQTGAAEGSGAAGARSGAAKAH